MEFLLQIPAADQQKIGRFYRDARRYGWTKEEVGRVLREALTGDYDHMVEIFQKNSGEWSDQ